MQTRNPLLDDLSRLATAAADAAAGARGEVESRLRAALDRAAEGMDLVDRESFETVRAMAEEARLENRRLADEIESLRAELAALQRKAAPTGPPPA